LTISTVVIDSVCTPRSNRIGNSRFYLDCATSLHIICCVREPVRSLTIQSWFMIYPMIILIRPL